MNIIWNFFWVKPVFSFLIIYPSIIYYFMYKLMIQASRTEAAAARTAETTAGRTAAAAAAAAGPTGGTRKLTHAHRPPHTATTAPHNNHTEPVRRKFSCNPTSMSTATSLSPVAQTILNRLRQRPTSGRERW